MNGEEGCSVIRLRRAVTLNPPEAESKLRRYLINNTDRRIRTPHRLNHSFLSLMVMNTPSAWMLQPLNLLAPAIASISALE